MRTTTLTAAIAILALAWAAPRAQAGPTGLIDNFNDASLAEYTTTTVLDNNTVRGLTFSSPAGSVLAGNVDTTPEQALMLRGGFTLNAGETLVADMSVAQQAIFGDLGIAVAASATPGGVAAGASGDVRTAANYIFIAVREQGDLTTGGDRINGATFTAGNSSATQIANITHDMITGLYITRVDADDFTAGYFDAANVPVQVFAVTVSGGNAVGIGNAVGLYADVRNTGMYGNLDNLRIQAIPEPASMSLLAVASAGMALGLRHRRR